MSEKMKPRIPATSWSRKMIVRKIQNWVGRHGHHRETLLDFMSPYKQKKDQLIKICCFSLPPQLLEKNMKKKPKLIWSVSLCRGVRRNSWLTTCSRQMFSRREPTQPQKVMMNMRTPTTISIIAGSTDRQARAASRQEVSQEMRF